MAKPRRNEQMAVAPAPKGSFDPQFPRHRLPYPLHPLPSPGKVISIGRGRKIFPLTAEEHAFSMALREAALEGVDFRGMMAGIAAAGFRVRPLIFQKGEGDFNLQGFTFTRGGMSLPASLSRLRIIEDPDTPRAPRLPEDGAFLVGLRDAFDRDFASEIEGRKKLVAELKAIDEEASTAPEAIAMLGAAGISAGVYTDQVTEDGFPRPRKLFSLMRGTAEIRISRRQQPILARAAKLMLERAAKRAERDERPIEPEEMAGAMEP